MVPLILGIGIAAITLALGEHERRPGLWEVRWHMPWGVDHLRVQWAPRGHDSKELTS